MRGPLCSVKDNLLIMLRLMCPIRYYWDHYSLPQGRILLVKILQLQNAYKDKEKAKMIIVITINVIKG